MTDKNKYRITVSNDQTADGKTENVKEIAYGDYYEKNGKHYIMYRTDTDDDKTLSVIKAGNGEIQIKRSGTVNSVMIYKIGEKRNFTYKIPYGEIEMQIETKHIDYSLGENGGKINMKYTLSVQGEEYYNDMTITLIKR